jgi:hypothetical protein
MTDRNRRPAVIAWLLCLLYVGLLAGAIVGCGKKDEPAPSAPGYYDGPFQSKPKGAKKPGGAGSAIQ